MELKFGLKSLDISSEMDQVKSTENILKGSAFVIRSADKYIKHM